MSRIGICATLALIASASAGCTAPPGDDRSPPAAGTDSGVQAMPADIQSILDAATRDASSRLNIDPGAFEVVSAERVTWSDGSAGCPEPGMQYMQALVPGFRVKLRAGSQTLDYHAAANGHLVLCPPERAIEPVPGDPI